MANQDAPTGNEKPSLKPVPVVAIGASAGGIEAVTELLQNLSTSTGLAYVYIQHLDQNFESRLDAVLSRVTAMPVRLAEDMMPVEANHVYVIPHDQDLEIIEGVLRLSSRRYNKSFIHMPIDQFFTSLAERQQDSSIAVLLSGTASDGTLGLRAIKSAGGITFAQDETAMFQSMPKSAISEGVVDMVLSPTSIAKELERLSQLPQIFQPLFHADSQEISLASPVEPEDETSTEVVASEEDLKAIIQIIRRSIGVDFNHYKITTIRRRIIRRMLLFKLETLQDYAQYLKQHPDEVRLLYNDLLINVTTFFRDDDMMDYLKKVLLPRIIKEKSPRDAIRIWVPACSTGQEAYSLAMMILELLADMGTSRVIQIFATDLSELAIGKARQGSYTRGEVVDVSPVRLQRFFTKIDDHYRINRTVRDICVFAPHNLLKDPPFSRLDMVSCRNLLIYLDNVLQRKAISIFHYALNPSGYLVLGKSETINASASLFVQLEKNYKIFARKNDIASRAVFEMSPRLLPDRAPQSVKDQTISQPVSSQHIVPTNDLETLVDEVLLRQYVPASVVVNQDLDILLFRGSTSLFLEPSPGKASLNLLKMARPSLAFELRNCVFKARKAGHAIRKAGLDVKIKDRTHYVAIEAVPLKSDAEEQLFLILFEEVPSAVALGSDKAGGANSRIKQLEEELATLREDMRSIIEEQEASNEELQSANEEIISSNEELQSINEELETSKEEIESSNEELLTINQELQVRNDQLSEANDFADAIFSTIREATLVLDEDLRVKSANQTFYRLFQVTEEDVEGRLIYQLGSQQWDIPQLRLLLSNIIQQNSRVEGFEVVHTFPGIGEKVLLLNARRVVRQQQSILLAIEDITEHRRAQRLLQEREAWLHSVVENAPTLIWIADVKGRFTYFNKVWLEFTGQTISDVLEQGWLDRIHPDDRESYLVAQRTRYEDQRPTQTNFRLQRHDGDYHWMMENAHPMFTPDGSFTGYIGTSADIHLQKSLSEELERRVQQRTEDLEQSNEMMRMALRVSSAGLCQWDLQTNMMVWDDRGTEIMGFEKGNVALSVEDWVSSIYPNDRERVNTTVQECIEAGKNFRIEYCVVHPDDSVHYVLGTGQLKKDNAGKPIGILGLVIDITDLKEVEVEITKNLTLLQQTEEVAKSGSWEYNLVTDEFKWSEGMYRLFGLESGQPVTPEAYLEYVIDADRPIASRVVDNLKSGNQSFTEVFRIQVNEKTKNLIVKGVALTDNGNQRRVLGVDMDITEQVDSDHRLWEREQQLQQTADNLQAVLNSSPAFIAFLKGVYNEQNELVDIQLSVCNQKFSDLVNRPISSLISLSVRELNDVLWGEETFGLLANVLATGEPSYQERFNQGTRQGLWTGVSISKEDSGVVLTGLDITALKQADQQQDQLLGDLERSRVDIQSLEQLRHQIRERGEFLRTTTHDLRGSFGAISGAASLIDLMDTVEERAQMMDMLQRNVRQVTHLLSELMDFARLEAGQETVNTTSVDVAELLQTLGMNMKSLASERNLDLITQGPDKLPVETDSVKILRIAQNLLLNALKNTQTGQINVSWGVDDSQAGGWYFIVEDTGAGMPPKIVQYLTSDVDLPADQATETNRRSTKSGTKGEGIGLIIVKQLCKLLNAQIEVNSQPNTGSQIKIHFPKP